MFAFIEGKLDYKEASHVIINVSGVGYHIQIPLSTYGALGTEEKCRLHTYLQVREDAHTLYGFKTIAEKNVFLKLISVSGVGANTGLMILSSMGVDEIRQAIVSDNVKAIQSVKGIGAKTAQRIILDLKDKFLKEGVVAQEGEFSTAHNNSVMDEALTALTTLGFAKNVAEKSVERILRKEPNISLEELIRQALKTA